MQLWYTTASEKITLNFVDLLSVLIKFSTNIALLGGRWAETLYS
jgi:hypothetical protein